MIIRSGDRGHAPAERRGPPEQVAVLCIGARNGLDEAAAVMLARLLVRRGVGAKPMPREAIAGRHLVRGAALRN